MKADETGTQDEHAVKQLQEEHRQYAAKLESFAGTSYLSADEQIEEVRLKKLKLRAKDALAGHRGHLQL